MLSILVTALRRFTELNFQSCAMFEGFEPVEVEGGSTESTIASSISACKKVLCINSILDSSEYWLNNEKTLCRIGLLDDDGDSSCTLLCFVNLDPQKINCQDDENKKKLASVSPDLPRLVELLTVRQPKENEILLLGGLGTSEQCQTHPHSPLQGRQRTGACLLPSSGKRLYTTPASIIFEINKFLIGLQWGKDQQFQQGRAPGQRVDDDTNRSISSIEEDFQTASEQLGEDSEDDALKNEPESGDMGHSSVEAAQKHSVRHACHRGQLARHQSQDDSDIKKEGLPSASLHTKESAGHYATNLAESVLQDAFIRLSQDETSFVPEAAISVSLSTSNRPSKTLQPSQQRTCSFELPKIVIVQSPDNSDGAADWSEMQTPNLHDQSNPVKAQEMTETGTQAEAPQHSDGHEHVELALACAATIIGTISSPQLTEKVTLETASVELKEEESQEVKKKSDYSVSSAMGSIAQVAGAVAAVDLAEVPVASFESDADSTEVYTASHGLMSAAKASTAFPLHCNVAAGTSVEAFRANIAEVLHREAAEVLTQPQGYNSVAHLLETTHNKIVDGITCPKKCCLEESEVDDLINEVADSLFKHALEKAKKKKELEGAGKDSPSLQVFLQDSVNNLLFEILFLTQKKISHISMGDEGSEETPEICSQKPIDAKENKDPLNQLKTLVGNTHSTNSENLSGMFHCTERFSMIPELKQKQGHDLEDVMASPSKANFKEQLLQSQRRQSQPKLKDLPDLQQNNGAIREPSTEIQVHSTERRGRLMMGSDGKHPSLISQSSLNSCGSLLSVRGDSDFRAPISCYAEDLAATVVSMATELAAICLENSSGKQPWFCALNGTSSEVAETYLMPACRTVLRRKESQSSNAASRKHRAPRLSEIKRKTEEQPELMERLVNRVVDESVNLDEPQDPFALFASEVTARIMNCPELNVIDTSKPGQQRSRLQCEKWSRVKASSYESIPEEDTDPTGAPNTLGPGCRLGQNLSRGSSISKQSSCESITDEFSRFMVNQMETEGRGFDLLLDYYAGKNASNILAAAVQQAATKKNGHLNVRASSCLSKQSSTESITEEFYRFMLRDMDKENKDYGIAKTKEWSNSLFPPTPRTPFCIRQSSVPDRRSSDSRLTVNSPIKANSFDGFARNVYGDTLNIFPTNSVSATGLCKSDSCLYQRGKTDQITDMLIHETWSSSIESLMRKNKIIADPEDSIELEASGDLQPHVQQFANRLAADIVDIGKSALGGQLDMAGTMAGSHMQSHTPVVERRRGFKQSHLTCSRNRSSQEQACAAIGSGSFDSNTACPRSPRDVPLIHIEGDQRVEETLSTVERTGEGPQEASVDAMRVEISIASSSSSERDRPAVAVAAVVKRDKRSMSASSEESMGSWSHVTPEDDPHEETSSFIQLSEGNGTSSASSLGLADLDAFSEVPSQSTIISEETKKGHLEEAKVNILDGSSGGATGSSSNLRQLLVVNCDIEQECEDSELRVALQWIAASDLGLPVLYFRRSKENRMTKFQRVVHLMAQKAWRIADLFKAVAQFYTQHETEEEGRSLQVSLFDWLLETI
uniref:SPHK1 interactor, AKAP domain containing n=1 Tax=Cyprinodon variegatus TaxID=28743 RepID=A0A3Q2EE61_CYPVA